MCENNILRKCAISCEAGNGNNLLLSRDEQAKQTRGQTNGDGVWDFWGLINALVPYKVYTYLNRFVNTRGRAATLRQNLQNETHCLS